MKLFKRKTYPQLSSNAIRWLEHLHNHTALKTKGNFVWIRERKYVWGRELHNSGRTYLLPVTEVPRLRLVPYVADKVVRYGYKPVLHRLARRWQWLEQAFEQAGTLAMQRRAVRFVQMANAQHRKLPKGYHFDDIAREEYARITKRKVG